MKRSLLVVGIAAVMLASATGASAATWTIQPVPAPVAHSGELDAVSCPSTDSCVAVGDSDGQTLADRWDGSSWSLEAMPSSGTDNSAAAYLNGVACVSAAWCMAVGFTEDRESNVLAEVRYGNRWSVLATPSLGPDGIFNAVSCVSRTDCVAVGSSGSTNDTPLIERWNGISWTVQDAPSATGTLTSVSCTSAYACTAVGDGAELLAERWNGFGWSLQTIPTLPNEQNPELTSVSCTTATSCTAVGSEAYYENLAASWDGSSWTIESIPSTGDAIYDLASVSCASASSCVAVGRDVIESFNGSGWTIDQSPNGPTLRGVSCVAPAPCIAVGEDRGDGDQKDAAVAERLDAGGWSLMSAPSPGSPDGSLTSVSCPTSVFCVAVGDGGDTGMYAEMWRSGSWSVVQIPGPSGSLSSDVNSVSCTSSQFCVAVGSYCADECLGGGSLIDRWNGNSWVTQSSPTVPDMTSYGLDGVSCTAADACTAVGSAQWHMSMRYAYETVAERWNGVSWSLQSVPSTAGLQSVSCAPDGSCTAINRYAAMTWDGTNWSATPVSETDGSLSGLSCLSSTDCIAVGDGGTNDDHTTLADGFDGSTWSPEPTPSPNPLGSGLSGVSCATADDCTAVGSALGTLVEHWDGSAWTVQPSPNPAHGSISRLTAVSCTQDAACVAIGQGDDALVEQYVSGPAAAVSVSLSPASIAPDGQSRSTVTATVVNAEGSRLAGERVSFSSSDSGETIGPVSDDGDGTYTATIVGSTTPGQAAIAATDGSGPPVSGQASLTQEVASAGQTGATGLTGGTGSTGPAGSTGTSVVDDVRLGKAAVRRVGVVHGKVVVSLACTGDASAHCTVNMSLATAAQSSQARTLGFGRASITLGSGRVRTVRLTLNQAGRRMLAHRRRLTLRLTVVANGRTLSTARVVLRHQPSQQHR